MTCKGKGARKFAPVTHRVTEVTRADVARIHHDLRHIPYDANRCLEMISKMFNLAEMWGLRPPSSARPGRARQRRHGSNISST